MEIFKIGTSNSYYSGQLLIYDGIRDGKNSYTVLSEVVLTRLPNDLYMNTITKENYIVDNNKLKEKDVICKVTQPLVNLKRKEDVEQYILSSSLFFKDRIDIYMHLPEEERKKLNIEKQIIRDIEDNTTYHKIISKQGKIIRAYEKVKR